jgi:hypothetical protein
VTPHLDPEELIAALDGGLDAKRQQHARTCEVCQASIAELAQSLDLARQASKVPEPSPLYWEHLSARVRSAVESADMPEVGRSWWSASWRPLLAGAVTATLIWSVVRPPLPGTSAPDATGAEAPAASTTWDDVVEGAEALTADDVSGLVPLGHGPVGLIEDLTPEQLDVFARLVEAEMGDQR